MSWYKKKFLKKIWYALDRGNKLRVLYIALEMDIGGLQRFVNLMINKLNRIEFEPYIVCLDREGVFFSQTSSVCAKSFVLGRKPGPIDLKMIYKLVKIMRNHQIDIIHSNNGCSMYAALAGSMTGVKGIIHTDHGRLLPDRSTAIIEDRFSSYLMDYVVGVSETLTQYLALTVKVKRNKLVTILNGVDTDKYIPINVDEKQARRREFGFDTDCIIIGTICRLDKIKNLDLLIESSQCISKKIPGCKIVIVGDGPEERILREKSKNMNLDGIVFFMGRTGQVHKIISIFDIYVNTSFSEGTSMTILEAMSSGLPVVASEVGGNIALVDYSNGALFQNNKADIFQKRIYEILADPEAIEKMGKMSRKKAVEKFSLDRVVNEYEKLYHSLS